MVSRVFVMAYKGPPKDFLHKLGHWGICRFSELRNLMRTGKFKKVIYSHVELNINGNSYSSSARDGGVRMKYIDMLSGSWDLFEIEADALHALDWFDKNKGKKYDWAGIFRFLLPFLPHAEDQYFCNEAVASMLNMENPSDDTPDEFVERIKKKIVA